MTANGFDLQYCQYRIQLHPMIDLFTSLENWKDHKPGQIPLVSLCSNKNLSLDLITKNCIQFSFLFFYFFIRNEFNFIFFFAIQLSLTGQLIQSYFFGKHIVAPRSIIACV